MILNSFFSGLSFLSLCFGRPALEGRGCRLQLKIVCIQTHFVFVSWEVSSTHDALLEREISALQAKIQGDIILGMPNIWGYVFVETTLTQPVSFTSWQTFCCLLQNCEPGL
jgi:hypothetical protein